MSDNKAGRKTTVVGYEERIPDAMEWMLYKKVSFTEFKKEFSKKYNISERQAEMIWSDVKERIKERFAQQTEEILSEQLQRYYSLLERARQDDDRITELNVLRELTKLYGFETKKIDVSSGGKPISINITLDSDDEKIV